MASAGAIPETVRIGFDEARRDAILLAELVKGGTDWKIEAVMGVPRGGLLIAEWVAWRLGVPVIYYGGSAKSKAKENILVVDDIADTGRTLNTCAELGYKVAALYRRDGSEGAKDILALREVAERCWVEFGWEAYSSETPGEDAITRLLQVLGEDPQRPGLTQTPERVVRAFREMTTGYKADVPALLARVFPQEAHPGEGVEDYGGIVLLRDIEFVSLCEHHLLPFYGTAHVAYIPAEGAPLLGLSKIARLVDAYARRLQVQERMTAQIADALYAPPEGSEMATPQGVYVMIEARHTCMGVRGVKKPDAVTVTAEVRGGFQSQAARDEVLALIRRGPS